MSEDEILEAAEWIERAMLGDRQARVRVANLYAPQLLAYVRELQRKIRGEPEPV